MSNQRRFNLFLAWASAFVLLALVLMALQVRTAASQEADENDLQAPGQGGQQTRPPDANPTAGGYPLFAGSDNSTLLPNVQIDVATGGYITAFVGVDAWGAAYDPVNDKIYHNDGSTLYEWQVGGGAPTMLGTVMDPTGASVTLHGLAFYSDTLYATSISTDEIYSIDLGTLVATPYISLIDTSASLSGLAIDPSTGDIYGTDDGTNDSLVRINLDGSLTPIAAYLGGETDVDGLAIDYSGNAYLITDDPTPAYYNVYNLNAMTYTGVVSYPWGTGTAAQVSGAWIGLPNPSIAMTKTVGVTPGVCATTNNITVPAGGGGTVVYYCYEVTNTGDVAFDQHDLDDDQLGTILSGFSYPLNPGQSVDTVAAGLTLSATITQTTVNSATWTAFTAGGPSASASATATVTRGTPTGVSLSSFRADNSALAPVWLAAILLALMGVGGLVLRRRMVR